MKSCGCTHARPAPGCVQGAELYAAWIRAEHVRQGSEEQWAHEAEHAYLNHVEGRRPGELLVRRDCDGWSVEWRLGSQWVFQFGTTDEVWLRAWLKEQGYWRYAQVERGDVQDRLTGFYRVRVTIAAPPVSTAGPTMPLPVLRRSGEETFDAQQEVEINLKTRLAMLIAGLLAGSAAPLGASERLQVQRQAIAFLLQQGTPSVGPAEVHLIDALMAEAQRVGVLHKEARANTGVESERTR